MKKLALILSLFSSATFAQSPGDVVQLNDGKYYRIYSAPDVNGKFTVYAPDIKATPVAHTVTEIQVTKWTNDSTFKEPTNPNLDKINGNQ